MTPSASDRARDLVRRFDDAVAGETKAAFGTAQEWREARTQLYLVREVVARAACPIMKDLLVELEAIKRENEELRRSNTTESQ